jgi:hypothetical protein
MQRIACLAWVALAAACGGRSATLASTATDAGRDAITAAPDAAGALACDEQYGVTVCHSMVPDPASPRTSAAHFVCRPALAAGGRLLVHLVDDRDAPVRMHRFALRACSLGFAAVVPAYDDGQDLRHLCPADSACAIAVHDAVLFGGHARGSSLVVPSEASVDARVHTALAGAARLDPGFDSWATWAARWDERDMSGVTLSGHGAGGDRALFLARAFAFDRVALLSAPSEAAGWIVDYPRFAAATPRSRVRAYAHPDDTIAEYRVVRANWRMLGIDGAVCPFSTERYPGGCRGVVAASTGCNGYYAHLSTNVTTYNHACEPGAPPNSNASVWALLLGAD